MTLFVRDTFFKMSLFLSMEVSAHQNGLVIYFSQAILSYAFKLNTIVMPLNILHTVIIWLQ